MKKYRCVVCGKISSLESLSPNTSCPYCKATYKSLEEYKEEIKKDLPVPIDNDNPSIARIVEKCIKCGRCSVVCKNVIGYDFTEKNNHICVNCGQCVLNCPTGALCVKYDYKKVLDYLHDTKKIVIVHTAPSVRVSLAEAFNAPAGTNVEGKMVASLKKLGFDYVFDTTFGADLTIMEEAAELVERIKENKNLPQFTSCCPAWVKYSEIVYPDIINNLSTSKSPISMQGATIKKYFAQMMNINPEDIIVVAVTPCTAKKYEIKREELEGNDFVLTASEVSLMLKESNIDLLNLKDEDFDKIMGRGSSAGIMFGNSGGVMEAALRNVYHIITKEDPQGQLLKFMPVRGYDNMKEASIDIKGLKINVMVIYGLKNINKVIENIRNKTSKYTFIEVMNCPGGCIGGGGQPLGIVSKQDDTNKARIASLYEEADKQVFKCSYQNQEIKDLYNSFLKEPLSHEAKELLHTKYFDKSCILENNRSLNINNRNEKEGKIMELKGSKTEKNLLAAFAGESQARNKYTYYASKAKKDGYEQIAAIFEETANNEKEHAKLWFKELNDGEIKDTMSNLEDAAAGEHYEWTDMYKSFAEDARKEGFDRLATLFEGVAKIESEHEKRYLTLLQNIKDDKVFHKDGDKIWICRNCGHIYVGKDALEVCPVCNHKRSYMEVRCENYK